MKKNRIAMIAMAVALTAGGSLITALPAAADPPTECPMLRNVNLEHISDEALSIRQSNCKSWLIKQGL